ncbi:hypothetical protein HMPREF9056_00161 [Actinomyces sp. oral taxon 170 str. F0386]|nr:hypothetical protein HMPREF9056_00161 [Actinomyces sp. oral taxon 170 str. F0386]
MVLSGRLRHVLRCGNRRVRARPSWWWSLKRLSVGITAVAAATVGAPV